MLWWLIWVNHQHKMTTELIHWLIYCIFPCYLWQHTSLQKLHSTVNLQLQIYGLAFGKYQFLLDLRKANLPEKPKYISVWLVRKRRSALKKLFIKSRPVNSSLFKLLLLYFFSCIKHHSYLSWFLSMKNWMMW